MGVDLFEHALANDSTRPLADRMRPKSLEEVFGHQSIFGADKPLGRLVREGHLPNLVLWGPPGTGKTTLALILARTVNAAFLSLNATEAGAKALRDAGEAGRARRLSEGRKTVLFVDEIHRFNKSQQDILLPFLEKGDLILLGATTENPSYELNRALLSRSRVIALERLTRDALGAILGRALAETGVGESFLGDEARELLLSLSDGDARRLLNSLETLILMGGERAPSLDRIREILGQSPKAYDKNSELHYDLVSAFIKSIRGSDADAGLYYLVRMLDGGEDPVFVARRLIILASEDIGNADPRALGVAVAGLQAVEAIGMPEGRICLAQVVTYLACAPKSNRSYSALRKMEAFVAANGSYAVPPDLRSSPVGYESPHGQPKGWIDRCYLPREAQGVEPFYVPLRRGFERTLGEYMDWLRSRPKSD